MRVIEDGGRMDHTSRIGAGLRLSVLLLVIMTAACSSSVPDTNYVEPPMTFQDNDLVGVWETRYEAWGQEWARERLILRSDGTFKQVYHDFTEEGYVYETPWNEWWVEHFPDGRIRVHLQGARIHVAGIGFAELEGMSALSCPKELPNCGWVRQPWSFYDPVAGETVHMVNELILNVRASPDGNIVLFQMYLNRESASTSEDGPTFFYRLEPK
jgi:hypothetical protein